MSQSNYFSRLKIQAILKDQRDPPDDVATYCQHEDTRKVKFPSVKSRDLLMLIQY